MQVGNIKQQINKASFPYGQYFIEGFKKVILWKKI